ncbi:MAG TPA: AAA family ATPase [Phycisphaerae bacterium]|nr:AAA family ATPase [Phycisphaerae bacterium]
MYCEYFGLRVPPFENTPDPGFFFNTPEHQEALASLLYAVQQRKGFVLLTGEVGTGKTLLSRVLLQQLDESVRTAVITNSRLSEIELLGQICREFDLPAPQTATKAELLERLEKFLLDHYAADEPVVLILDEAQNLLDELFEELRMMGNLEADDAKLLQVVILGQPELQRRFGQDAMRQMRQRLFRSFHLGPLTREQTEQYVHHRLAVSGGDGQKLFSPEAIDLIHRHSGGLPRMINQLCDAALLTAYGKSSKQVTADTVELALDDQQHTPACQSSPDAASADELTKRLDAFQKSIERVSDVRSPAVDNQQIISLQNGNQVLSERLHVLAQQFDEREKKLNRRIARYDQRLRDQNEERARQWASQLEEINQQLTAQIEQYQQRAAADAHQRDERLGEQVETAISKAYEVLAEGSPNETFKQRIGELQQAQDELAQRFEKASELAARQHDSLGERVRQALDKAEHDVAGVSQKLAALERGNPQVAQHMAKLSERVQQREQWLTGQVEHAVEQACRMLTERNQTDLGRIRVSTENLTAQLARAEKRSVELVAELKQAAVKASTYISRLAEQGARSQRLIDSFARLNEGAARHGRHLHEQLTQAAHLHEQVPQELLQAQAAADTSRDLVARLTAANASASQQVENGVKQLTQIEAAINAAEVAAVNLRRQMDAAENSRNLVTDSDAEPADRLIASQPPSDPQADRVERSFRWPVRGLFTRPRK